MIRKIVLIIESDEHQRSILSMAAEEAGFDVLACRNSLQALHALDEKMVHMIVHHVTTLEIEALIKKCIYKYEFTPKIFVSSSSGTDTVINFSQYLPTLSEELF